MKSLSSILFLAVTSFCLFVSSAAASQITYAFDSGVFQPRYYEVGDTAANYKYRALFDLSGVQLVLDTVAGSAHLFGDFSGVLQDDTQTNVGTSTAFLDMNFFGLDIDPVIGDPAKPIKAIGVQGTSTSSGYYSFVLDFDTRPIEAETINVYGGFANVGATHTKFGDLAGIPFNFLLRDNGLFDVWVKSEPGNNFSLFNEPFALHGDIHGQTDGTDIPEPTTMLLLGSGLLGGMCRRKKLTS